MTGFINPFSRQRPAGFSERLAQIKHWTRSVLALSDEIAVSVNELACSQPDCPPKQTVILLLMEKKAPIKIAIHKPLLGVDEPDILDAIKIAGIAVNSVAQP